MITNDIIFLDFETTGVNPLTCQPVQLAAVVIDGRKLEIVEGSEFQTLILPELDEYTCAAKRLDPLTEGSIRVHGKTPEILSGAPNVKLAWKLFVDYVNSYNPKGGKWNAPIMAGYNVVNYDSKIINRLVMEEPYKFGPMDNKGECSLFNPRMSWDLIHDVQRWTHFNPEITSVSFDNMRKYTGMSTDNAHDAMQDVKQGALFLCKFLNMYKKMTPGLKLKGSCVGF